MEETYQNDGGFQWEAGSHGVGDFFAASDISRQFFSPVLDENLFESQYSTLLHEISSASSSPNYGASSESPCSCSSQYRSISHSAFSRYCQTCGANSTDLQESSEERGKCTRKRMLSWILEKFECLNHERNMKRKVSPAKMELPDPTTESPVPDQDSSAKHLSAPSAQQQQLLALSSQIPHLEQAKSSSHNHMIAERNRRLRERELKGVLMSCIPASNLKKKDKNSLYQYTIEYIKELKQQVAVLQQQSLKDSLVTNYAEVSSSTALDDEATNKSSCSSLSSMVVQEDGKSMRLSFDSSGNNAHIDLKVLIDLLSSVQDMGFEIGSIHWKPETSSILALTVHSTMNPNQISGSQLCETLEQKLFPAQSLAARTNKPE